MEKPRADGSDTTTTAPPGRRPWWKEGEEPDYRATLANERTFLSWTRTSLALLAGALAVLRLSGVTPYPLRLALTAYLILLAVAAAVTGYLHWRIRQARMRHRQPLGPTGAQAACLIGFLILAGIVITAVITSAR